jgi:hypothetical protein
MQHEMDLVKTQVHEMQQSEKKVDKKIDESNDLIITMNANMQAQNEIYMRELKKIGEKVGVTDTGTSFYPDVPRPLEQRYSRPLA